MSATGLELPPDRANLSHPARNAAAFVDIDLWPRSTRSPVATKAAEWPPSPHRDANRKQSEAVTSHSDLQLSPPLGVDKTLEYTTWDV